MPNENFIENEVVPNENFIENDVVPNENFIENDVVPNENFIENDVVPNENSIGNDVVPLTHGVESVAEYNRIDELLAEADIASNTIEPNYDIGTIATTENISKQTGTDDYNGFFETTITNTQSSTGTFTNTEVPPFADTEDFHVPVELSPSSKFTTESVITSTSPTFAPGQYPWEIIRTDSEQCGFARFGRKTRVNRGRRMMKILKGKEALPGSFPWQVAVLDKDRVST